MKRISRGVGAFARTLSPAGEAQRKRALTDATKFFREHAGGLVGQRLLTARKLALAEEWAAESGVIFTWEDDPESGQEEDGPMFILTARLDKDTWEALGGINEPDRNSGRVFEAELASELLHQVIEKTKIQQAEALRQDKILKESQMSDAAVRALRIREEMERPVRVGSVPEVESISAQRARQLELSERYKDTGDASDPHRRERKLEMNPGDPPALRAAIQKYITFHAFEPSQTREIRASIPEQAELLGEATTTFYKSDKWTGKPQAYYHDHDGGVHLYLPGRSRRLDARGITVPAWIRDAEAICELGECMGVEFSTEDGEGALKTSKPRPLLCTIPSGKALIIVSASLSKVEAIIWGGDLNVLDVGIVH